MRPSISRVSFREPSAFFGQVGAVGRRRKEPANARPRSADAFGQIALRHQLKFNLSRAKKPIEHVRVGLPGETADHLAHTARFEQRGQALLTISRVVVHHGQVACTLRQQAIDQFIRDTRRAKAPDQHRSAIAGVGQSLCDG